MSNDETDLKNNLREFSELASNFQSAILEMEKEQEEYWQSLTPEQQLDVFCCISRRIFKGEIEEKRSYRGMLYGVFGWGPEAYLPAQSAGYLGIHNSIYDGESIREYLVEFGELLGFNLEDPEQKEKVEKALDKFVERHYI